MTIIHYDTYMSSGLDYYPACEILGRSDYVKSSYNILLFPVGGAMTITHKVTYMSSGLDSYPACEIWGRSDDVKSS